MKAIILLLCITLSACASNQEINRLSGVSETVRVVKSSFDGRQQVSIGPFVTHDTIRLELFRTIPSATNHAVLIVYTYGYNVVNINDALFLNVDNKIIKLRRTKAISKIDAVNSYDAATSFTATQFHIDKKTLIAIAYSKTTNLRITLATGEHIEARIVGGPDVTKYFKSPRACVVDFIASAY